VGGHRRIELEEGARSAYLVCGWETWAVDFIARLLEGFSELSVARGDVPATVDDDDGGFGGGHGSGDSSLSWVQDARARNSGDVKEY
jgi:hypothetical protein